MKKLLFITASILMLSNANIQAQVNYENTYLTTNPGQESLFLTNLGNDNYKYVVFDYYNDKFSLYNIDHTPFMLNISFPISTDSAVYRIGYITNALFDCDSTNIEYALMTTFPDDTRKFLVYRTDGTLIFSKDSVTVPYCYGCNVGTVEIKGIVNTPAGAKLSLFKYINGYQQSFIYGLCGILPSNITEINHSTSYVKVFPNPVSHQVTFEIIPPSNLEKYELTIFNSTFQIIKIAVINGEAQMNLNTETLSSGEYFYSLQNKNKIFQTGKISIIH